MTAPILTETPRCSQMELSRRKALSECWHSYGCELGCNYNALLNLPLARKRPMVLSNRRSSCFSRWALQVTVNALYIPSIKWGWPVLLSGTKHSAP